MIYYSLPKRPADGEKSIKVFDVKSYFPDIARNPTNLDSKCLLFVSAGYSYTIGIVKDSLPTVYKNYAEDCKKGYNLQASGSYFFWKHIGIGLDYSFFRSDNHLDNAQLGSSNGALRAAQVKDRITVQYIGPSLCDRMVSLNKKSSILSEVGIGYFSFKDEGHFYWPFTVDGSSMGAFFGIKAFHEIMPNLTLGLNLKYFEGVLRTATVVQNGMTQELKKIDASLSRLDISLGASLRIF